MATPSEPRRFFPFNNVAADQIENAVSKYAEEGNKTQSAPISQEEWDRMRREIEQLRLSMNGMKEHLREDVWGNWAVLGQRLEDELGYHLPNDCLENLVKNGGFKDWNAGVTLPTNWTATGTATLSRQTRRTGARAENYACRIVTAGATGGFAQVIAANQLENVQALGFWVKLAASASLTVTVVSDGTGAVSESYPLSASEHGAAAWFALPTSKIQGWNGCFSSPSDATTLTLTFTAGQNSTVDISDVQIVLGPKVYPSAWAPHPADFSTELPQNLDTDDTPTFEGIALTNTATSGTLETDTFNNGAVRALKYASELITIVSSGDTSFSTLTLGSYWYIKAILCRVTVAVPGPATTMTIYDETDAYTYGTGLTVAANSTLVAGVSRARNGLSSAGRVQITADAIPGANTGRVRITVIYEDWTPPTS